MGIYIHIISPNCKKILLLLLLLLMMMMMMTMMMRMMSVVAVVEVAVEDEIEFLGAVVAISGVFVWPIQRKPFQVNQEAFLKFCGATK